MFSQADRREQRAQARIVIEIEVGAAFDHRERRGDRHVMRDHHLDQMPELGAVRRDVWDDVAADGALPGAGRRLAHAVDALRIEIAVGRNERPMLEIVDAEGDRLLVADRAQMAGDASCRGDALRRSPPASSSGVMLA